MAEWDDLANEMRALDTRVARAQLQGADADPWIPPGEDKGDQESYLERVLSRLRQVRDAVKRARTSAEQRVQDAAEEVAGIARSAAERARKLAHTIGSATEKSFHEVMDSMERGALAFGAGAALVVVVLLLLLRESRG